MSTLFPGFESNKDRKSFPPLKTTPTSLIFTGSTRWRPTDLTVRAASLSISVQTVSPTHSDQNHRYSLSVYRHRWQLSLFAKQNKTNGNVVIKSNQVRVLTTILLRLFVSAKFLKPLGAHIHTEIRSHYIHHLQNRKKKKQTERTSKH